MAHAQAAGWEEEEEEQMYPAAVTQKYGGECEWGMLCGGGAEKGVEMEWVLDSGAKAHMASDPRAFVSLRSCSGKKVGTFGGPVEVKGVGEVVLVLPGGDKVTLKNVLYLPDSPVPIGLISVGLAMAQGAKLHGDSPGHMLLELPNGQMMHAHQHRRYHNPSKLFYVQCSTLPAQERKRIRAATLQQLKTAIAAAAVGAEQQEEEGWAGALQLGVSAPQLGVSAPAAVWHKRMGHTSYNGLQRMVGKVEGMAVGKEELQAAAQQPCELCVATNLAAAPHPQQQQHTVRLLELVHSNVAGPIQTVPGGEVLLHTA